MLRLRWLVPVLMAVTIASAAVAAPVPGLFDTGVDGAGAALPGGSVDPHYVLVTSADPAFPGPNAIVPSLIANGFWVPNAATSKWIAPANDESYPALGTRHSVGAYLYRLSFDLTGLDPATVTIQGSFGADNNVVIRLNGSPTTAGSATFTGLRAFTISTGFVAGVNQLDFVVTNAAGSGSNPTGLRVQGLAGTGNATTAAQTRSWGRIKSLFR